MYVSIVLEPEARRREMEGREKATEKRKRGNYYCKEAVVLL
jgi:hypothetical protein